MIRLLRNWPEAILAGWRGTQLTRLQLRNGALIRGTDTQDLAFLFHEIWVSKVYSPAGCEIRDGDVVVDVGANIGVFSIFAATSAKDVRVFAYEPYPACASLLRENVESSRLKNVNVNGEAVAGTAGSRKLLVNPTNWIVNRLAHTSDCDSGFEVKSVTLNDVFSAHQIEVCNLLKLDCEGAEYEILRACTDETLSRIRRIVGEYHESAESTDSGRELCRILEYAGFKIESVLPFDQEGGGLFIATNRLSDRHVPMASEGPEPTAHGLVTADQVLK